MAYILNNLTNNLQTCNFDSLPTEFKKGWVAWMYEGGIIDEWSVDKLIEDWVNDKDVIHLINDYSKIYGDKQFTYGILPLQIIVSKIEEWINAEGDHKDFKEWHAYYQSSNDCEHLHSRFPIMVNENWEEFIEDGWHRFSYYVERGFKNIPIINITRY